MQGSSFVPCDLMPVVGAVDKVAELALADAEALDKNAYKIDIAKTTGTVTRRQHPPIPLSSHCLRSKYQQTPQ